MDLIEPSSHSQSQPQSVLVQNPHFTEISSQENPVPVVVVPSTVSSLTINEPPNNSRSNLTNTNLKTGPKIPNRLIGDAYDSDGDDGDDDDAISNSRLEELTNSWLTPAPIPPQTQPKMDTTEMAIKVEDKDKETNITNNEHNTNGPSSSANNNNKSNLPLSKSEEMKRLHKETSSNRHKRDMEEEEREKMQVLVSNFTEEQLDRYEMYRRAAFPKAAIKRIMHLLTGTSVSQNAVIAMSGIAKVFVGEIVEESLDVMERNNESGPVQPKHIREAVRKMRLRGAIPNSKARKFNPYSC